MPLNIICVEVDIDESLDLCMSFKNKKIINGIPAILAFYGDVKRDSWFLPDDIFAPKKVIEEEAEEFLGRCSQKAITIV